MGKLRTFRSRRSAFEFEGVSVLYQAFTRYVSFKTYRHKREESREQGQKRYLWKPSLENPIDSVFDSKLFQGEST